MTWGFIIYPKNLGSSCLALNGFASKPPNWSVTAQYPPTIRGAALERPVGVPRATVTTSISGTFVAQITASVVLAALVQFPVHWHLTCRASSGVLKEMSTSLKL